MKYAEVITPQTQKYRTVKLWSKKSDDSKAKQIGAYTGNTRELSKIRLLFRTDKGIFRISMGEKYNGKPTIFCSYSFELPKIPANHLSTVTVSHTVKPGEFFYIRSHRDSNSQQPEEKIGFYVTLE